MNKKMQKKCFFCSISITVLLILEIAAHDLGEEGGFIWERHLKKEDRRRLVATEYGEISAVRVGVVDNIKASYLLHFFTLEPNSLMLPVMLHSDMVFYVHTGGGKVSWTEKDELKSTDLRRGDVYRLHQGSVFFLQSNLDTEAANDRQKLRIHAIFTDDKSGLHGWEFGPYTNIRDLVMGFGKKVLQEAFQVSGEVIEQLFNGTETPAVIHALSNTGRNSWEMESEFVGGLVGIKRYNILLNDHNKKKKSKSSGPFNIFKEDKDFENCNGWSTMVTTRKMSDLKGLNTGLFVVNLTEGSMMGPHWNPTATEVAVVLQGQGMIRIVCPGAPKEMACWNLSFMVEEGDVFVVPRFHAMAQMAFNNQTFVFMGFSTSVKNNHPQFFAGQASVLRTMAKDVSSLSFNVTNTTMDQVLASQWNSVILKCISCAEENWKILEEKEHRDREEVRKREEEASRKREEEKRKEEEEAKGEQEKKREQEEMRKQEEEMRKRQEEERKREEEDVRKRQEEEERKQEEEEEARKRQEEEAKERKWEKEETIKRQEEEGKREEEEAMKRQREQERRKQKEEERKQEETRRTMEKGRRGSKKETRRGAGKTERGRTR